MPRVSPLGIDGTSVAFRDPDARGRPTVAMVRARDENGTYQAKRFKIESYRREDGSPILPEEAREWAKATRKEFMRGASTAGRATIQEYLEIVAVNKEGKGVNKERISIIRKLALRLEEAGITDMKSPAFAAKVGRWLNTRDTNWAYDEAFKFRRTHPKPLEGATKNRLRIMLRQATAVAIGRRCLAFDPLFELERHEAAPTNKELFTVAELRQLASDESKEVATRERARLQARVDASGLNYEEGRKLVAEEDGIHWITVYNRLKRPLGPDPWWLPCCLLVYTGARAQEALHLRWEWIKWDARVITLKERPEFDIKNGERNIPLEPELAEILKPMAKPHGWIIEDAEIRQGCPGTINKKSGKMMRDYQEDLVAYCKRIGLEIAGRTVHSLRHTFITMKMAMPNLNTGRLRKAVGHGTQKVTEGYSKQSQEYEAIVDAWPDSSLWLRRPIPAAAQAPKAGAS